MNVLPEKQRQFMKPEVRPQSTKTSSLSSSDELRASHERLKKSAEKVKDVHAKTLQEKYNARYQEYLGRCTLWDYKLPPILEQFNRINSALNEFEYFSREEVSSPYPDVLCPKETAVPVYQFETYEDPYSSDSSDSEGARISALPIKASNISRIHGNYVHLPNFSSICTQAPMWNQVRGFWNTAFTHSSAIIDLTNDKDAIYPYHPHLRNPLNLGCPITVECTQNSKFNGLPFYSYEVTKGEEKRALKRLHYPTWPDGGVLSLEDLKKLATILSDMNTPMIHCKAGVGRTGTTVIATALLKIFKQEGLTPQNYRAVIDALILTGREQRGEVFVQNSTQYKLLIALAEDLLGITPL